MTKPRTSRSRNVDGKMVSLKDFKNVKGYIVVFTCNHCPFAKAYEQRIIELHKKYQPLGYPVVAINPNDPQLNPEDSYEMMQQRAKEKAYPFAYLFDEQHRCIRNLAPRVRRMFSCLQKTWTLYTSARSTTIHPTPSAVKNKYVENAINALKKVKSQTPP